MPNSNHFKSLMSQVGVDYFQTFFAREKAAFMEASNVSFRAVLRPNVGIRLLDI